MKNILFSWNCLCSKYWIVFTVGWLLVLNIFMNWVFSMPKHATLIFFSCIWRIMNSGSPRPRLSEDGSNSKTCWEMNEYTKCCLWSQQNITNHDKEENFDICYDVYKHWLCDNQKKTQKNKCIIPLNVYKWQNPLKHSN